MICETKTSLFPSPAAVRSAGFCHVEVLPTIELSGRVWLMWEDDILAPFSISIMHKASRFLACNIHYHLSNIMFIATFLYAPAENHEKNDFWTALICYVNSLSLPYIILGDFNEISSKNDKLGGASFNYNLLNIMNMLKDSLRCIEPFVYG